jgi:predicted ATP-grasp superfamily ATP-dependent carboligase
MEHVRWLADPDWHTPVVVSAFSGWNDAGDASTMAVRHLIDATNAEHVASIDPEEFVEFQSTRPVVRLVNGVRQIEWPATEVWSAKTPFGDLMLVSGAEPQLRWRAFCRQITDIATQAGSTLALSLGALLADVPHTRPVNVLGTASDQGLIDRFGLQRSQYEGPTGIVGVLNDALGRSGIAAASLWAAVPAYAAQASSPKAALALLNRLGSVTGGMVPLADLEQDSAMYVTSVSASIEHDDDLVAYVRRLESALDEEPAPNEPTGEPLPADVGDLMDEVEQFLRDQRGS